ncbi:glycoside hydrolase family 88 protein [Chitinophaga sedimenti]|uniref:glycoside hydrolase family 88 protein n=1 Tax=Chitinophaga sedimenti TaxID=2033606 RepID=UPI00200349DF|nr:glycoside hydrolase family 88 protein [Chitinophaga sedimenti]MCK7557743.1 glycoside hydrolase family 88 protein [Chitinophaga sedimenti]
MKPLLCILAAASLLAFGGDRKEKEFISDNFGYAQTQLKNMLKDTETRDALAFPRTTDKAGKMTTTNMYDWTPGFFPGSLWYAYEGTKDPQLLAEATKWTEKLEPLKDFTKHHDLGFMVYCSYGNAYRITGKQEYKDILIQSAKSLSTRFNPVTGSIKSWNAFKTWHGEQMYYFPVIIDNMMNLELLFFASKASGDNTFRDIAIKHAETAMKNQIRKDYSSYHVVCYDTTNGKVLARETAQGYADNSTWSRGQAWGIYGFTMVYRETKDKRFLKTAEGMADWFLNNKNLPADMVPYWDFNVQQTGYTPGVRSNATKVREKYRDASAAAIVASALFELSDYVGKTKGDKYREAGKKMLRSLAGPAYRADLGANGNFMIKHCVGSIPHNGEIDVPLVYADYYFLEALQRYQRTL